jgi:hypothetical protein
MQQYNSNLLPFKINYIIISEQISFLPNNILKCSRIVNIKIPEKNIYKYLNTPSYIDKNCILNLKEIKSINKIKDPSDIPSENFDIVCNTIIEKMIKIKKFNLTEFRELLYEILIYNLDFNDVLWNIMSYFIKNNYLSDTSTSIILKDIYKQIKYYNNNYRPIYHLENIIVNILNHIHFKNESNEETLSRTRNRKRNNNKESST